MAIRKTEAEKEQTVEQNGEVQQTAENQASAQAAEADKGNADSDEADSEKEKAKTVKLTLRHKSHTPHYHRCGLTLTKTFAEYEVSEDCVERIKGDKWIEVKDSK